MRVYRLSPVEENKSHRDWAASLYQGECEVAATDEADARAYAVAAFAIAARVDGGPTRFTPWRQQMLVRCVVVAPDSGGSTPPEGLVMLLPRHSGRPDFMALGPAAGEIWSKR
jgi:hypothetical protein